MIEKLINVLFIILMVKTKLQEAQEEIDEEKAEEFQKMVEAMTGTSSERIQRLIVLPLVYAAALVVRIIPNFTRELYYPPRPLDQPFTAYFIMKYPSPSVFIAPLFYVVLSYYIIICKGSIATSALITMTMIFSEITYSYASQNIVVTLCLICLIISLNLSHSLLYNEPYSLKWFGYYFYSMIFGFAPLYVSCNYIGFVVASYIACFISSFSRFGTAKGNKARLIIESFLLLITSYSVILPLVFCLFKLRDMDEDANPYVKYYLRFSDYTQELQKRPATFEMVALVLSFALIKFGKYRYVNVVPLIQVFIGVICILFIPYETPGEPVASRVFLIKTLSMIWAGIVFSASKYSFIKYGIPALLCFSSLGFHIYQFFVA